MRILQGVMILSIVVASPVGRAADADDATCRAACAATLDSCQAKADADAASCRTKAHEPCEEWCPCDQFIGAAHFACLAECDRCEAEAERIAAKCPDGSEAKASCVADHRRCTQRCPDDG